MQRGFSGLVHKLFLYTEKLLNVIFSPKYNPFYLLGAITIFFLWLLLISGLYLFIFYKMSPEKAYDSVQYLTVDQWYLGGIMRSIHRYASDAIIISMTLHTLQVFFKDKYRRQRWLAWVSGVALIAFVLFEGLSGYWLVWDQLAQMVAIYIAELLDFLPIFGEPLTRAFVSNTSVTGLFFFLMLGMHIAFPLFGLIFILVHIARISRPKINPPWLLNIAMVVILLALSLIKPAISGPPADFTRIPASIGVDWFYLFYIPMLQVLPPSMSWVLTIGFFGLLAIIPWIPWHMRRRNPPIAAITLRECTGCGQCFEDCPYKAIIMQERKEDKICPYCGRVREKEAVILPDKCMSCSICVGACDYRAITFGNWSYEGMKKMVSNMPSKKKEDGKPLILGLVCKRSVNLDGLVDREAGSLKDMPNVTIITIPCSGVINPNIFAYTLRRWADGVFVSGCPLNDCHFRFGNLWLKKRLKGERNPKLKVDVSSKVRVYWLSAIERKEFLKEIRLFEDDLIAKREVGLSKVFREKPLSWVLAVPAAIFLLIPTILIFYLSDASYSFYDRNISELKLSFKHTTKRVVECDDEGDKLKSETERYQKLFKETGRVPMRQIQLECGRERNHALVELYVDEERFLAEAYRPRGLKKDGAVYIYRRWMVDSGSHRVVIKMRDSDRQEGYDYIFEKVIEFKPGEVILIDFDELKNSFVAYNLS